MKLQGKLVRKVLTIFASAAVGLLIAWLAWLMIGAGSPLWYAALASLLSAVAVHFIPAEGGPDGAQNFAQLVGK